MSDMPTDAARVPTRTERVKMFLRGGIVAEGNAHVEDAARDSRVTDLLNRETAGFLPLTDCNYQAPNSPPLRTGVFLVHIADIVAVDLVDATP